jgi:hypothetical protein
VSKKRPDQTDRMISHVVVGLVVGAAVGTKAGLPGFIAGAVLGAWAHAVFDAPVATVVAEVR